MRVLQAVTLVSPEGAYGGPVTVALNQAQALRTRGHDVTLAAGYRGYDVPPVSRAGTPLVLRRARPVVPRAGFASFASVGLQQWIKRNLSTFDVVHLHMARDLVMIPLALEVMRRRMPYVVQPHGMITSRSDVVARACDHFAVRRILQSARAVFYLTGEERDELDEVARGGATLAPLTNGVPSYPAVEAPSGVPEVIFLGRLHPRKRPLDFVRAALALNAAGAVARYSLVGPDEGEAADVETASSGVPNVAWEGPCPSGGAPARLRTASIFVLPSVREPYPMAVLEAMSVGLPVVITHDCGLAPTVERFRCGIVIEPGADAVAEAVGALLADPVEATAMGRRGRAAIDAELGMDAVADELVNQYLAATASSCR